MKTLFIIYTSLISFSVIAQSDELEFKREIGVNLAPVIILLYTGDFALDRIDLSYVKHRTTNFSWRMKLSIRRTPDGGATTPSAYSALFRTDTISTNSSITELYRYYQKEVNVIRGYFSAEYVKRFGMSQFYSGIGVVPGIAKNHSYRYRSEFETGTGLGSTGFAGDFYFRSFMLGVSPYLGFKIQISKRMLLNFQTGVEFDYHFRNLRPVESSDRVQTQRSELLIWPVMSELGFYVQL